MPKTLSIWCNAGFPDALQESLRAETAAHPIYFSDDSRTGLADANIAFGQPDPEIVLSSERLRWVHLTSAGYTRYDRDDVRDALQKRGAVLTNSSHVYDEPCAQHALALLLAFARQLPQALQHQQTDRLWNTGPLRASSFLLNEQSIVFLGFGAIGQRLARLLAPLDMRITAVRRTAKPLPGFENVAVVAESDADRVLGEADHVMNILPESPSTMGFVGAERLAKMKPGARFYNIGRGATVDQTALIAALESGQVGAAYLDVTSPEPLPANHPLWTTPNCYITPHSAGGHDNESERLVRHFLQNLRAFEREAPLTDRVF